MARARRRVSVLARELLPKASRKVTWGWRARSLRGVTPGGLVEMLRRTDRAAKIEDYLPVISS